MNCLFPVTYRTFIHLLKHFSRVYCGTSLLAGGPVIPVMSRHVKVICWVLVMFSRAREDQGSLLFCFPIFLGVLLLCLSVWLYAAQTFWLGSRARLFVSILLFQVLQQLIGFPAKNWGACLSVYVSSCRAAILQNNRIWRREKISLLSFQPSKAQVKFYEIKAFFFKPNVIGLL